MHIIASLELSLLICDYLSSGGVTGAQCLGPEKLPAPVEQQYYVLCSKGSAGRVAFISRAHVPVLYSYGTSTLTRIMP